MLRQSNKICESFRQKKITNYKFISPTLKFSKKKKIKRGVICNCDRISIQCQVASVSITTVLLSLQKSTNLIGKFLFFRVLNNLEVNTSVSKGQFNFQLAIFNLLFLERVHIRFSKESSQKK